MCKQSAQIERLRRIQSDALCKQFTWLVPKVEFCKSLWLLGLQIHALRGHRSKVVNPVALSPSSQLDIFFPDLLYDHDGEVLHGVSR